MLQEKTHKSYVARIAGWLVVVIISAFGTWAVLNTQYVVDIVNASSYAPGASETTLRNELDLTDAGKLYFDASNSQIQDAPLFNKSCGKNREPNNPILGCYASQRIFIYNVTNSKLDGIEQTTAAHEVLHAAYERLDVSERTAIDNEIKKVLPSVMNDELQERLEYYERTEPGEKYNELHSILGTEFKTLSKALEEHYARYFNDRSKIVKYYLQYSTVFNGVKKQLIKQAKAINARTDKLNIAIDQYNQDSERLNSDVQDFNARAESGGFSSQAEFIAERAALTNRESALKSQEQQLRAELAAIKKLISKRDDLVDEYNELNASIDSTIEPLPSLK